MPDRYLLYILRTNDQKRIDEVFVLKRENSEDGKGTMKGYGLAHRGV